MSGGWQNWTMSMGPRSRTARLSTAAQPSDTPYSAMYPNLLPGSLSGRYSSTFMPGRSRKPAFAGSLLVTADTRYPLASRSLTCLTTLMSIPIGMFSTIISIWPALRRTLRSVSAPAMGTGGRMSPKSGPDAPADAERSWPLADARPPIRRPFAISRIVDAARWHHQFATSRACPGTATPSVALAQRNLVILKVAVLDGFRATLASTAGNRIHYRVAELVIHE